MRKWALKNGDPLTLVLAADARMSDTDYADDQIWELKLGQGEAMALSWQTTYGARARDMRLFVTMQIDRREVAFARDYHQVPRVQRIAPNLIEVTAQPEPKLPLQALFFALDSHTLLGRLTLSNPSTQTRQIRLSLAGILSPLDGSPLRVEKRQNVHVLHGESRNLHPFVFMTGGVLPAEGPHSGLQLDFELGPGASRTLTWTHVALPDEEEAFRQARRAAAQPLDALAARADLLNASDTVTIETGDPDWDAMLALSQTAALSKLFSGGKLPNLTCLASRRPDQGYASLNNGRDHHPDWQGQTVWDVWYLMQALPGAPHLWRQIFMNFLAVRASNGWVDARPGPAGQRLGVLATPLLAQMAWRIYRHAPDDEFLQGVYPLVRDFFWAWFAPDQDRDRNGIPEWTHSLQSGYEDNPLFAAAEDGQAIAIDTVQSPVLAAFLYGEAQALQAMAQHLQEKHDLPLLQAQQKQLIDTLEACWVGDAHLYAYCDRDTHLSLPAQKISDRQAQKRFSLSRKFDQPLRLQVTIRGQRRGADVEEVLPPEAFIWQGTQAVATTQQVFDAIGEFTCQHVTRQDRIVIHSVDLTQRDLTLFAPLCMGVSTLQQTRRMLDMRLLDAWHFLRPYGLTMQPASAQVSPPWNALLANGLLSYGLREQAAQILVRLGQAAIRSLQSEQAFYAHYDAHSGQGLDSRHALRGVFPVDLFLRVLGVEFLSPMRVRLSGQNPFAWPITVRYRTLTIERGLDESRVRWLDGEPVIIPGGQTRIIDFSNRKDT